MSNREREVLWDDESWWHDHPELSQVDPSDPVLGFPPDARPKSVFGPDERELVRNVLMPPFRWVAQVFGYPRRDRRGTYSVGSGFVIGSRTILTAAHNLWADGQRVSHCLVFPGVDGDRSTPRLGVYSASVTFPHRRYEHAGDDLYDVAVLVLDHALPADLIPPAYGFLRWMTINPDLLQGAVGMVSGYPKDVPRQPPVPNFVQAHQYYDYDELISSRGLVFYKIDTTEGQSGSPLLVKVPTPNGNRLRAVGIHSNGRMDPFPNSAVPITPAIGTFIKTIQDRYEPRLTA